jgi:hypothetical protein
MQDPYEIIESYLAGNERSPRHDHKLLASSEEHDFQQRSARPIRYGRRDCEGRGCFSHPTTPATSWGRNCLSMAVSHRCRLSKRN